MSPRCKDRPACWRESYSGGRRDAATVDGRQSYLASQYALHSDTPTCILTLLDIVIATVTDRLCTQEEGSRDACEVDLSLLSNLRLLLAFVTDVAEGHAVSIFRVE